MKIIRKNRSLNDCSIIAAYNASSWCNLNLSYENIMCVAKTIGYDEKFGITFANFNKLTISLNLPAIKLLGNKIDPLYLQQIVRTGKAIVLLYRDLKNKEGHAVTLFPSRDRIYILNKDKKWASWDEFAAELYAGSMVCHAWVLPYRGYIA